MPFFRITVLTLVMIVVASAKNKPTIQVRVVDYVPSERYRSYTVPGTAAQSNTNCAGGATAVTTGNVTNLNGSANCTTTTTPETPATTKTIATHQVHAYAVMPDGRHVTLWCQAAWRRCADLGPGTYTAEVDGNSIYVYFFDLSGKFSFKVKYQYVGNW